jgi:hypothetical protein
VPPSGPLRLSPESKYGQYITHIQARIAGNLVIFVAHKLLTGRGVITVQIDETIAELTAAKSFHFAHLRYVSVADAASSPSTTPTLAVEYVLSDASMTIELPLKMDLGQVRAKYADPGAEWMVSFDM